MPEINGSDILSTFKELNLKPIQTTTGYIVSCNSSLGICYVDSTRAKHSLRYKVERYRPPTSHSLLGEFSRFIMYGTHSVPIYIHDCWQGHGQCNNAKNNAVAKLFNNYFTSHREKKPSIKRARRK